jgi:hypothetical protein
MRGRAFGVVLCGLLGSAIAPAMAADLPTKARPIAPVSAAEWLNLFGGAAVDKSGWFADAGMVAAFNRNLNQAGWLFRIRGGGGHYEYNRAPGFVQGVDYAVGEVMLGYHVFVGRSRLTGYLGANVEQHDNPDPGATVKGTEWGAKVQGEIFTDHTPHMYSFVLATYSTAYDSYFALGKVGFRWLPQFSVGPEAMALGNDRFDSTRAGGFVAFEVTRSSSVIFSGGYAWDTRRDSLNDHSGGYGTVHLRALF